MGDKDQLCIEAVAHPIRRKILRYAVSKSEEVSPSQASRWLGEDLSNVSYHMKCLVGFGLMRLAYTQRVRGATKHFYAVNPTAIEHPIVQALLGRDSK